MSRSGRRQRGFSLLELAVVAVILSLLLGVLLERLNFYQEAAERARFEATLQVYKTALQIRLAELMLERREGEARLLEVENPTRWLSEKPTDYGGSYPQQPEPGIWYFDETSRELVYVANSARRLAVEPRNGLKQLRFRVKIIYQPVVVSGKTIQAIGGMSLLPSTPFQWS
ncbi:MAG: prepilin-type N-terminal cleavage/methylation domain-containing protein [Burkholderiales bacterium]|nr:prepilin-type N-terminal cleavage/methylation domain-containing protein [Burkholderiales bacterium]MDP2397970.1 prepilin-type N-terminal cleavage/methylation domain-containing protein [Burkholderiales bacterium]